MARHIVVLSTHVLIKTRSHVIFSVFMPLFVGFEDFLGQVGLIANKSVGGNIFMFIWIRNHWLLSDITPFIEFFAVPILESISALVRLASISLNLLLMGVQSQLFSLEHLSSVFVRGVHRM